MKLQALDCASELANQVGEIVQRLERRAWSDACPALGAPCAHVAATLPGMKLSRIEADAAHGAVAL